MTFRDPLPVTVSISQAAKQLGVSVQTVHRWLNTSENKEAFGHFRVGLKWRIPQDTVDKLISGELKVTFKGGKSC